MRCFLFALFCCLTGCSTISTRIKERPSVFPNLSQKQQQAVLHGEVMEGMNKDAVYLSWGKPDRVAKGSEGGQAFEEWVYETSKIDSVTTYEPGYQYFGRYHRYGSWDNFHDSVIISSPTPYKSARFVGGLVDAWRISPQR